MTQTLTVNHNFSNSLCIKCIQDRQEEIHQWLTRYERIHTPFYTSVDIRDAGFKIAIVDTNLFPAGFNNLCEHGLKDAVNALRDAILKRVANAQNIVIAAEEHTRNTWYLENVRILEETIVKAGFQARIATFFDKEPSFCDQNAHAIELKTSSGQNVRIHCFKNILNEIKKGETKVDLIILNNDLSGGIPEALKGSGIPTYPSMQAGWHSRHKSTHFKFTAELMEEFSRIVDIDPWFFTCLNRVAEDIDINLGSDRQRLHSLAVGLFAEIQAKYSQYKIDEKPYILIKADAGTYGLGVVPIEDPSEILELNRRKRNDLAHGKSALETKRFILQEGVPTIHRIEQSPCEVCIYQVDNNPIGGFYRTHMGKTSRQNLNAPGGMAFQKMCPHLDKYGKDCGIKHNLNVFDIYRILARIAGVAASREIHVLDSRRPLEVPGMRGQKPRIGGIPVTGPRIGGIPVTGPRIGGIPVTGHSGMTDEEKII